MRIKQGSIAHLLFVAVCLLPGNLSPGSAPETGDSLHRMASLFALLFSVAAFLLLRQKKRHR